MAKATAKTTRPGSMAEADEKSRKIFMIVAGIIFVLILMCFFVFNTYLHQYARRAGAVWNIIGVIGVAVSYYIFFFKEELPWKIGAVILLALSLAAIAGFDFGDIGIKNIP